VSTAIRIALILAAAVWTTDIAAQSRGSYGSFVGSLDLRLSKNGRDATLLAPFAYVDPTGKKWQVNKGITVNGASIPQPLWSIVGSPWTGRYREASVIHDYYCDVRTEPWKTVHRTFYYAMLANDVAEVQAKVMYAAVYRFGPRWKFEYTPTCPNCLAVPYRVELYRPAPDDKEVTALKARVERTNPPLEEIEREADAAFGAEIQRLELGTPVLAR